LSPKVLINPDEITLPSSRGSSRTLKCTVIGASASDIQWFRNSTTKIEGTTPGSLDVKFISAQNIISTYKCTRKIPNSRTVICTMSYTCRLMLAINATTAEATAQVKVNLTVIHHFPIFIEAPAKQAFTVFRHQKALMLTWRPEQRDDVGRITGYKIMRDGKVFPVSPSKTQVTFTGLQAYTTYRLKMKAISVVGEGIWSDVKEVTTLISVPEGRPSRVFARSRSSTSIEVTWKLVYTHLVFKAAKEAHFDNVAYYATDQWRILEKALKDPSLPKNIWDDDPMAKENELKNFNMLRRSIWLMMTDDDIPVSSHLRKKARKVIDESDSESLSSHVSNSADEDEVPLSKLMGVKTKKRIFQADPLLVAVEPPLQQTSSSSSTNPSPPPPPPVDSPTPQPPPVASPLPPVSSTPSGVLGSVAQFSASSISETERLVRTAVSIIIMFYVHHLEPSSH
ncbi:hypothetical protein AC249_AIPGENE13776, partial [Exaiptasia diaphana]